MSAASKGSSWGAAIAVTAVGTGLHACLVGLSVLMLLKIVPEFEYMFRDMGASLPILTQLTIDAARSLRSWWFLWLPLLAMAGLLNAVVLLLLARRKHWLWSTALAAVEAVPLALVPAFIMVSLYLPIFAMASAIE